MTKLRPGEERPRKWCQVRGMCAHFAFGFTPDDERVLITRNNLDMKAIELGDIVSFEPVDAHPGDYPEPARWFAWKPRRIGRSLYPWKPCGTAR